MTMYTKLSAKLFCFIYTVYKRYVCTWNTSFIRLHIAFCKAITNYTNTLRTYFKYLIHSRFNKLFKSFLTKGCLFNNTRFNHEVKAQQNQYKITHSLYTKIINKHHNTNTKHKHTRAYYL